MTPASALDQRASWPRLAISLTIGLVGNVGMWAIIVILPAVQAEFNAGRGDASLPWTLTPLLAIAGIGCCVAMSMPQVHIVAFCTDLGHGPAIGAEMLSLMLLGGVASRLVSGALADWVGGVATLLILVQSRPAPAPRVAV